MKQNIKCYKCGEIKSINDFPKDRTANRGYHGYCKKCKYGAAQKRKIWLDPKTKQKRREYGREQKLLAIKYKGGKCVDCGYDKHPAALCFHHLKNKDGDLHELMKFGFEKTKKELDKCILLCHNCHDIRHFGSWKGERHKK